VIGGVIGRGAIGGVIGRGAIGVALGASALGCADADATTSGSTGPSYEGVPAGEAAVSIYSYGPPQDRVSLVAGYRVIETEQICTEEMVGECTVYDCARNDPGGALAPTGKITVTVGGRSVSIEPDHTGGYGPTKNAMPALFHGGETVAFDVGESAQVPHHGASLVAPSSVTLSKPTPTSPIFIDRAQDLEFAWTGGTTGELLFAVAVQRVDGSLVSESCRFPVARGSATVPASTLARLPAGEGPETLAFLWVMSRAEVDASPWHPSFSAFVEVLAPSGDPITPAVSVM
jgi:hypothetical protein